MSRFADLQYLTIQVMNGKSDINKDALIEKISREKEEGKIAGSEKDALLGMLV